MATYTVDLTPATAVGMASEGSLDTVRDANGNSLQRTMFGVHVVTNTGERKMVGNVKDGGTFTDVVGGLSSYPNIR
jgi:hypothetical protein